MVVVTSTAQIGLSLVLIVRTPVVGVGLEITRNKDTIDSGIGVHAIGATTVVLIVFMSQHDIDVMNIKLARPVQDFLSSAGVVLVGIARQTAIVGGTVTNKCVVVSTAIGIGVHEVGLQGHREAEGQSNSTVGLTIDHSTTAAVKVVAQLKGNVAVVKIR